MDHEKLVRMANQIGTFFHHEGEEKAPGSILHHILDFWDPRMRQGILDHLAEGGSGLDPLTRIAIERLRDHDTAAMAQ